MPNIVRNLRKNGVAFIVTYDSDRVVDTISRNGKIISAAHRDARSILKHADAFLEYKAVPGWGYGDPRPWTAASMAQRWRQG